MQAQFITWAPVGMLEMMGTEALKSFLRIQVRAHLAAVADTEGIMTDCARPSAALMTKRACRG